MAEHPSIFRSPSVGVVAEALVQRARRRLASLSDAAVLLLVEDTIYSERLRLEEHPGDEVERELLAALARAAVHGDRELLEQALVNLVHAYAEEIHHPFSRTAHSIATRLLPGMLSRLVTATDAPRMLLGQFDASRRIRTQGEVDALRSLASRGQLLLVPTHLSNLDSPLVGYGLHMLGLPPFTYGAGLNLFSNPLMAFWLKRLGAYTVDRRKRHELYKGTLKDYSVELFRRGYHCIFFPGGTRSRNGLVEKKLKKGLLGTGLQAWQEGIRAGDARPDVFVVPCTLSTHLVLEAESLIDDALAAEGRSRFIIDDDESTRAREVASFTSRVLNLDESVYLTFGQPLDVLGNPVDAEGNSLDPLGRPVDRRQYVLDAAGGLEADEQRDREYTDRLAEAVVRAFHRDNVALSTHLVAFATWERFAARYPGRDPYRLVRTDPQRRLLPRAEVIDAVGRLAAAIRSAADAGRIRHALGGEAEALFVDGVRRFGSFHSRKAVEDLGDWVRLDPKLSYYYRNRLVGYGFEGVVR